MTNLKEKFGKRLQQIRREKQITQEDLAERVGLSVDFIGLLERGINAPSFKSLEALAKALGVHVKEFFNFEG